MRGREKDSSVFREDHQAAGFREAIFVHVNNKSARFLLVVLCYFVTTGGHVVEVDRLFKKNKKLPLISDLLFSAKVSYPIDQLDCKSHEKGMLFFKAKKYLLSFVA